MAKTPATLHADIERRFPDNSEELITPLATRNTLHDLVEADQRGPNYRASGMLSVIYLTQAEADRAGHPEYATLEGLDQTTFYNGMVCRVDLHPGGFGIEMQLVYDNRADASAGILGFIDGTLKLYAQGQVNGKNALKWVRKDSIEARAANVGRYSPTYNQNGSPAGYRVGDLVTWRFDGVDIVFQSEEGGTDSPAPSSPNGDAYWRLFKPAPATYQAWQTVTPDELRELQATGKLSPARLYIVSPRVLDDGSDTALPDVFVRALMESELEPTGWLLVGTGNKQLVNYDLATDTTTPVDTGTGTSSPGGAPQWVQGSEYKQSQLVSDNELVYLVRRDIAVSNAAPASYLAGFRAVGGDSVGGAPQWVAGIQKALSFVSDNGAVFLVIKDVSAAGPQPRPAIDTANFLLIGPSFIPTAIARNGGGGQTYAGNNPTLALNNTGGFGNIFFFANSTFSANANLASGAQLNGGGAIADLAGYTLSFAEASVLTNLVIQSGVLRCRQFGLAGTSYPLFVGGLSAAIRHDCHPTSTVVFENRRVAANTNGYTYSGGGKFILRGTTPQPAAGDVEPGTTVIYEGAGTGTGGNTGGNTGGATTGPWPTPGAGVVDDVANTFRVPIPLNGNFQNRELAYHLALDTAPGSSPVALATNATSNSSSVAYRDGNYVVVNVGNSDKQVGAVGVCVLAGAGRAQSAYSTNQTAYTATVASSIVLPVGNIGTNAWYLHRQQAGAATLTVENQDTVRIEVTGGTSPEQVQFKNLEGGKKMTNGKRFKLNFLARADANTTLTCSSQSEVTYADLGLQNTYFELTDTYQKFEVLFTAARLDGTSNDALPDFNIGNQVGRTIWLSSLVLMEVV